MPGNNRTRADACGLIKPRLLLPLIALGVAGCLPGSGSHAGGDAGASGGSITLRGTVESTTGSPLSSATLTWKAGSGAATSVTADGSGDFTMTAALPAGTAVTTFTVNMQGYAPQVVAVPIKSGVTTYTLPVTLTQLQLHTINPAQTTTIQFGLPGPDSATYAATLTIPPGLPAGANVRLAPIDIGNSPGLMRAQGAPPGDALASLGMFYVDFADANGNQITPPSGVQVSLGAQTPPSLPQSDPFNAWSLNGQGYWDNPTPMDPPTGSSPSPPAPVQQFGYWNSDHSFRTACISGVLQDSSGECGGARLDLKGPDGIHSVDSSGADGSFCLVGPQGHSGTLSAALGGTTVSFPKQAGNCSVPSSCTDVGSFNISDSQCQAAQSAADGGTGADASAGVCISAFEPKQTCTQQAKLLSGFDTLLQNCIGTSCCAQLTACAADPACNELYGCCFVLAVGNTGDGGNIVCEQDKTCIADCSVSSQSVAAATALDNCASACQAQGL